MDFTYAKPSFFISEQVPWVVRKDGQGFIDFIETYYDWLERRIVILTLSSDFDIENTEIEIGKIIGSMYHPLLTEDGKYIVVEDETSNNVLSNDYSLKLNGIDTYCDYSNNIFTSNQSFTVSGWVKLNEYPSLLRSDFDIITLNNETYFSIFKIFENSNYMGYNIANTDISTDIELRKNQWNFFSIRYEANTNTLSYDIKKDYENLYYENIVDLSTTTSNRFVIGCDLYNSRNFSDIVIDEISIHNSFLSNTEITQIFNNGTPVDVSLLSSNSSLQHWYRFEDRNESFAYDNINANNLNVFGNPIYEYDAPINLKFLITEYLKKIDIELDVLSYIKYEGVQDGTYAARMLVFAEHIYGNLERDFVLKNTANGPIVVSDYIEAKNFLNAGNFLSKIQEIDYAFNYKNFIDNVYFIPFWKEIMSDFPLFLHPKHEEIKNIITKQINTFYKSKGTFSAIVQLFKMLYNKDLVVDEDVYSIANFEYTVRTDLYLSSSVRDFIEKTCHPVGYKLNLISAEEGEFVIAVTNDNDIITTSSGRICIVYNDEIITTNRIFTSSGETLLTSSSESIIISE
jgi:hypothetical protein